MNIYKCIGLDWLLENDIFCKLEERISLTTRYIVPGYKHNYRLCSFPGYVEFHRCELLDGTPLKTDLHFSSNNQWNMEIQHIIEDDISTPIYALKGKSGSIVPVRFICPDVLASVESGTPIKGQVVAFANTATKLSTPPLGHPVLDDGDNCVTIIGSINDITTDYFEFDDRKCSFYEIDLDTDNGVITVLLTDSSIDFVPEIGDSISVHACISMDVSTDQPSPKEAPFYKDQYEDSNGEVYRNGLLLDFHRNQKVFINSILTQDFSRLSRCFADTINFVNKDGYDLVFDKEDIIGQLELDLPHNAKSVEVQHILSCKNPNHIGHDGIVVHSNVDLDIVIWFDINDSGLIDELEIFYLDDCSVGIDYELHLHTMFAHAVCDHKCHLLHEYITDGCMYRSEYADICLVGAKNIVERFADINTRLNNSNSYTYEIAYSKDELCEFDDLPVAYHGARCSVNYQAGQLAYVAFLTINEDHKINNILLSCNPHLLKRFEPAMREIGGTKTNTKNVVDILSTAYGTEDTFASMRNSDIPTVDKDGVYIWKKADEFATTWLNENGYKISDAVLVDDCLGYACERKGTPYAVFFYAYGNLKTSMLDGDYCSKLRREPITQGREILVIYLHVIKNTNSDGTTEYTVEGYGGEDRKIEPWLLTNVAGRDILRFYPRKELMDLAPRLISAYNTKNLDALKSICTDNVVLDSYDSNGHYINDSFYSHLSSIREQHGKMKLAYIRFNDVVFSATPYIDGYAYVTYSAGDKIGRIEINPLNNLYRELLILDDDMDYCAANVVPALSSAEFLDPSDISRFSIRLTFENGEVKRFDLPGEFSSDEVVRYQNKIMTDRIFANGHIVDHVPLPDWWGYRDYAERGQGIEFMSGVNFSTEELYYNSYPVGSFSYSDTDDVQVMQMDYAEDGFGIGYIHNVNPANRLYLLDKNAMTATALPEEYQNTRLGIYPFYGGYSEGLIMVSKLGELDLQYHHNMFPCAGMWGWIDRDMNVAIEPKYIYAINFVNNRAIVCKGDWDIKLTDNGKEQYWCENEQWGVIDKSENEIVPCRFDELHEIDNTDRLYFVHEGGWDDGHYAIYDTQSKEIILVLDFDFDIGYMFNECFLTDNGILVFDEHLAGEEKDLIYAYDLINKKYIAHGESLEGRTFNGETKAVVNRDGEDIIIF